MSTKLVSLVQAYEEIVKDYEAARQASSVARSREVDALNRLNTAQKEVEKCLDELRKKAPPETDWQRKGTV